MIRDLRYQEAELNHAKQRFWKRLTITLLICGVLGSVGWREWDLQMRLRAIPVADETRLDSLNERVGAIDALVEGNPVWLGILPASRERARLKKAAALAHNKLEERGRLEAEKAGLILAQAESARLRGRMAVDRKDLKAALVEFRKALEFGPDGWQHRERLERDIAALSGLFEENVGQ